MIACGPASTFLQPVDGTRSGKRDLADLFIAAKTNPSDSSRCKRRFRFSALRPILRRI